MTSLPHDQLLILPDGPDLEPEESAVPPWTVLVVDDEMDMYTVTRLILGGIEFQGRPIRLIGALSAEAAKAVLAERKDIALVLLDVVMESDDAGLRLVRHIREELQDRSVQIVLRTGQPGSAPERNVVFDYDINGYALKTEMTSNRLLTTVITALRSYLNCVAAERALRLA